MVNKETSIQMMNKTKTKLNKLKLHPRESYENVILRLIKQVKQNES